MNLTKCDFFGVYQHDGGNTLMGVKSGMPFSIELGYEYDETDIEIWLDKRKREKKRIEENYGICI